MYKLALNAMMFGVIAALSLPAYAQESGQVKTEVKTQVKTQDDTVATLRVNKGVVMSSTGGEFVTASTGEQLIKDERLMISKDSSATVVFNDHCQRTYDEPGVYKIDADCKAVVWFGGPRAVAFVIASVVATGVIVHNINGHNPRPISR